MTNATRFRLRYIGRRIYGVAILANHAVIFLGAAAMALLPIMIFYDVAARYFFLSPTIWAEEVSIYTLQLVVFLPLGLLVTDDSHIRVTLLVDALPARVRMLLHQLSLAAICVFAGFIIWWGWLYTDRAWDQSQVSPTLLAVPLWLPHALIPLGGVLLLISALGTMLGGSIDRSPHNPVRSY